MIKRMWWVLMLAAAVPLSAQDPTGGGAEPQDTVESAQLRQQIEQRFHEIVRQRLALTDDQDAKLRATQEKYRTQRQPLFQRQFAVNQALDDQMRPGIAANPDSVRRMMDERQQIRGRLFQVDQDEDREMSGYLTPVQRAQFQMLRGRFIQRISELRQQRQRGGTGGRPGVMGRPRAGGGMRPRATPQQRPRRRP